LLKTVHWSSRIS